MSYLLPFSARSLTKALIITNFLRMIVLNIVVPFYMIPAVMKYASKYLYSFYYLPLQPKVSNLLRNFGCTCAI